MTRPEGFRLRNYLKEPLLHFAILFALIFTAHAWLSPDVSDSDDNSSRLHTIEISANDIEAMVRENAKQTGIRPDPNAVNGLIQGYIDEEILYREALLLGLDQQDPVVRRRLVEIMRYLLTSADNAPEPSTAELDDFIKRHPERYALPTRFSFTQLYLAHKLNSAHFEDQVRALSARLSAETPLPQAAIGWGDPFLLGHKFADVTSDQIIRRFGPKFLSAVEKAPLRSWSGPIQSPYGVHWIYTDERRQGSPDDARSIRDRARRDLLEARQRQLERERLDGIRQRYHVRIAPLPSAVASELVPQAATSLRP